VIRLPHSNWLIRAAVIIELAGLLMVVGILLTINVVTVGLFMLGSLLITVGIALYLVAVVRDLRERRAL
jgi:hypothetical protein